MRAKKIVNQSSDFPVRRTGSYRHKKALFLLKFKNMFFNVFYLQVNVFNTYDYD